MKLSDRILRNHSSKEFEDLALEVFRFQYDNNLIYRNFCTHLKINNQTISSLEDIPFLPISFFKTQNVISTKIPTQATFYSSATTGLTRSRHLVADKQLYEQTFLKTFESFYGSIRDYHILALLPSYMEQKHSSLIYMVEGLAKRASNKAKFLYGKDEYKILASDLLTLDKSQKKTLLMGVSYALWDLAISCPVKLKHSIIMETGGMKGRRREIVREELHNILRKSFGVKQIHSEYGMTELLSQAYSKAGGIYHSPPWMKVVPTQVDDPLSKDDFGKVVALNIIDLANIYSCSFLATQDLGKVYADGSFQVLGRFDEADTRGCNLMTEL